MQTLNSKEDMSVNFVFDSGQEARFVRRTQEYVIVYLSSHNGCNMACRFCHLTQSGQTSFNEASLEDMLEQAKAVLNHYDNEVTSGLQKPAQRIHFNWMARGEPLASSVVQRQWEALSQGLHQIAVQVGLNDCRFNLSSIFPKGAQGFGLTAMKGSHRPVIFYSLYSLNPNFRKRWLPKARDPEDVMLELSKWQLETGGEIVLHWAFIDGENDSAKDTSELLAAINRHGPRARFNLVRYNPFGTSQGQESSESVLAARFSEINQAMLVEGSRMVPRVGFDVQASCGMFVIA